jgi:hypothetical protein
MPLLTPRLQRLRRRAEIPRSRGHAGQPGRTVRRLATLAFNSANRSWCRELFRSPGCKPAPARSLMPPQPEASMLATLQRQRRLGPDFIKHVGRRHADKAWCALLPGHAAPLVGLNDALDVVDAGNRTGPVCLGVRLIASTHAFLHLKLLRSPRGKRSDRTEFACPELARARARRARAF